MTAEDGRPIIDEEGRLFGAVNIIDALVVLFAVVIVVGGVWFVAVSEPEPDGDPEPNGDVDPDAEAEADFETGVRYATLDLGTVSPQIASRIEPGDEVGAVENTNLTITDVYRTQIGSDDDMGVRDGGVHVFVRVELEGIITERNGERRFEYGEEPPRIGDELRMQTDLYGTNGRIQSVDTEGTELEIQVGLDKGGSVGIRLTTEDRIEYRTVLETRLSATTADMIAVGDEYTVDGQPIGTIKSIEVYGTDTPDIRRVQIGVTYSAFSSNMHEENRSAPPRIREGATLPFETERYELNGEVRRVGATEPRGNLTTRTVTLELSGVTEQRAEQFEAGLSERVAGETVAEITDVDVTPELVTVSTSDGELIERESPTERTVTMTAELRVRETMSGPRFKDEPLRVDDSITLVFDDRTVRPTVVSR